MKKLILTIVLIGLFISCRDKCRYVDPSVGNPIIEIIFLDSSGINLFDSQFEIIKLKLTDIGVIDFDIDSINHSILFDFNVNHHHNKQHSNNYEIEFNTGSKESFSITYESSEYSECGSWDFNYVYLIHDGVTYTRPQNSNIVKVKI
jgi:hypothetical protein